MENSEKPYNLRQRKMVPQANVDIQPAPTVNSLTTNKLTLTMQTSTTTAPNGNAQQNGTYDALDNHHGNRLPPRRTLDVYSGSVMEETSLTEPLIGGSDSDDSARGVSVHARTDDDRTTIATVAQESSLQIGLQVFFPYMIAGFGMVGAGMVLDTVQHWPVFTKIPEVFILVPSLLGLKGNLEMTLASRLSTQANLGNMDCRKEKLKMIGGNLALTQAQAIVVGFLASIAAMIFGWIPDGKFNVRHGLLLCASSVSTASLASLVLGSIMVGVVLGSHRCKINPDNVATPIAASLGDLTTLALLSAVSSVLFLTLESHVWLCPVILTIFLCLTPLWCVISHRNKYTNKILYEGWTPVIGAMIISSIGGLILDFGLETYKGIAVFQPVINGVGGNLVAVQASRLSTALHQVSSPGNFPPDAVHGCPNLCSIFFGTSLNSRTVRVLMLLVIPGHLVFMYTIYFMQAGHTSITIIFTAVYLLAALIQVAILLYLSGWLVHYLWMRGNDPDNFSIPYLTAMGDLLGTGLLFLAFAFLYVIGDRDADVGE